MARVIADALRAPHLEMDAVMHAGRWNATPDDEFRHIVDESSDQDRWVVDGNYTPRRPGDGHGRWQLGSCHRPPPRSRDEVESFRDSLLPAH